jgi:hypothetical protein
MALTGSGDHSQLRILQIILSLGLALSMQASASYADQLSSYRQGQSHVAPKKPATNIAVRNSQPTTNYTVRYDRYGVLGIYHVTLIVDSYRDGVHQQRLYIDGAGRPTKQELNLGFCKLKFRLPPAHLAAYVNPKGYEKHFLGLLTSKEFGPAYALNEAQGTKLIVMAHHAMTSMNNSDELLYFTIPFKIGPLQVWTSNSIVASLVKAANEEGIKLPFPADGYYPGFKGPFLAKSYFQ